MSTLKRNIGLGQLFAISFASTIGVGWIVLLGFWLETAGPIGSVMAFTGGLAVVFLIALAYAEVSAMFPIAGAEVAYAQMAFGSNVSFAVAWMLLTVHLLVICFETIAIGWIATVIFPALRGAALYQAFGTTIHAGELIIGVAVSMLLAVANLCGVRFAAQTQWTLMILKVGISLVFITAGFWVGHSENLQPAIVMRTEGWRWGGVFLIFSISFLFYGGFNFLPQALEERSRDVSPRQACWAMLMAVVCAFLFYAAVILSASMVLPRAQILSQSMPAAAVFQAALHSVFLRNLVLFTGFLGVATALNGSFLVASRSIFLMSRLKLLPEVFGRIHTAYGTPFVAILILWIGGVIGALLGRGAISVLTTATSAFLPLTWAIVCLVALRLRITRRDIARPFWVPAGSVIFMLGLLGGVFATAVACNNAFFKNETGLSPEAIIVTCAATSGFLIWLATSRLRHSMSERERQLLIAAKD